MKLKFSMLKMAFVGSLAALTLGGCVTEVSTGPAAPGVWVPAHYNRYHVWVPGHYMPQNTGVVRGNAGVWVPGHYNRWGGWVGGHWR